MVGQKSAIHFFSEIVEITLNATVRAIRKVPVGFVTKIRNEPIGAYAAGVATFVAALNFVSYTSSGPSLELSVRCVPSESGFAEDTFIYVPMSCLVRNTGTATSSIDTISINYLWSNTVRIGERRKVYWRYPYWGERSIIADEDFQLPRTIDPGVTLPFNAYAPIPIGWLQRGDDGVWRNKDVNDILEEFNNCISEDLFRYCFLSATNKNFVEYLYNTIHYPGGQGGTMPISGIEISVNDFDYIARQEIDFVEHFGGTFISSEDVMFGLDYRYRPYKNLRLPWWKRKVTIWTWESEDGKSRSGTDAGPILSSFVYLCIIISLWGFINITIMIGKMGVRLAKLIVADR